MKVAWLTDTHLNVLKRSDREAFFQSVVESGCDAALITGDISETPDATARVLQEMHSFIERPIYFVLGNHDYYASSVDSARARMRHLHQQNPSLVWLPTCEYIPLSAGQALVGQDGFADARLGDFSIPDKNDFDAQNIVDLIEAKRISRSALQQKMQQLSDEDADQLHHQLICAIQDGYQTLLIATHIPPYAEVAWRKDKPYDAMRLPYFTNHAAAKVLESVAAQHPQVSFLVLCGHTHTAKSAQILDNLRVSVGYAKVGAPKIVAILENIG